MARRPLIFELRKKARFLMTHQIPRGVINEPAEVSINRLHTLTGVPLASLQQAVQEGDGSDGLPAGDDKLGEAHQELLARFFRFEIGQPRNPRGWVEWSDPLADDDTRYAERRDTAAKFQERYVRELGPPTRDTTEQLMEGPPRTPVTSIDGLASIELTSGQIGIGQANIGIVISCDQVRVDGSQYNMSLGNAVLAIDCGLSRARRGTILGFGRAGFIREGSHGVVRWHCSASNTQKLRWRISAEYAAKDDNKQDKKGIGTVEVDQSELVLVEQLAHGDVIAATLGTWLKYIEPDAPVPTNAEGGEDILIVDNSGREAKLDLRELTIEQRRIMEHLKKRRLNRDESNFAVVASHEMQFIRRARK